MEEAKFTPLQMEETQDDLFFQDLRKKQVSSFLFKVYTLLVLELTYAASIVSFFTFNESARLFAIENYGLSIGTSVFSVVFLVLLLIFKKRTPHVFAILFMFISCNAYSLAAICSALTEAGHAQLILQALLATIIAFIGLSIFVLQTKIDFTFLGGGLFVSLVGLMFWGFLSVVMGFDVEFLYSLAGALIFSLYIVYDTSKFIKEHASLDYIEASVELYLDFVNLFILLAKILISIKKK
jgi:FtsH-binding integral membrane protein